VDAAVSWRSGGLVVMMMTCCRCRRLGGWRRKCFYVMQCQCQSCRREQSPAHENCLLSCRRYASMTACCLLPVACFLLRMHAYTATSTGIHSYTSLSSYHAWLVASSSCKIQSIGSWKVGGLRESSRLWLIWLGQAKDDAMMLMMHGMRLSWALKRTGDLAAAPG